MTAQNASEDHAPYFPFANGIGTQLPKRLTDTLRCLQTPIESFLLRIAQPYDAPYLRELLLAYGSHPQNYADLEQYAPNTLERTIQWLTLCLEHRYFITFLLFQGRNPIALFQLNPYTFESIEAIVHQKLLPFWNGFFKEPILLPTDSLLQFASGADTHALLKTLKAHFNPAAFANFCHNHTMTANPDAWLTWLADSFRTFATLGSYRNPSTWISNISYNLMPGFQKRGLMSRMLQAIEHLAAHLGCTLFFSDRVAADNHASIALLKRNGFTTGGAFTAYYGSQYKTRMHAGGNFSENCLCFYKQLQPMAA
jgi:RimJ/RimL family protein N-acetyltransferase